MRPVPDSSDRRAVVLAAVALFAAAFALYAPTLGYGFVEYDDVRILLDHPQLYDEHSFAGSLRQIFAGYFPREEPLLIRDVTWAIDSRVFGLRNAFGHHLGNVLLAAANAPLLMLFLRRATGRLGFAVTVAAAWLVLPVHVEPVAWVMGRKDLLCACFSLAALLCEAAAFRAEPRRARFDRAAGFVCCTLAVLSKTSAVTLVGVLAAYRLLAPDVARIANVVTADGADDAAAASNAVARRRSPARDLLGLVPHFAVSAAVYVWYGRVLAAWGVIPAVEPWSAARVADMLHVIPLVIGCYVGSIVAFTDYSIIYAWPDAALKLSVLELVGSAAIAVAIVVGLVVCARRRRDLLFYAAAFFIIVLPYLHFVGVIRWRADRYVYLASFGIVAIVVQLGGDALTRLRRPVARVIRVAAVAWLVAAAAVTLVDAPRFASNHALWAHEAALPRPSPSAFVFLASSFADRAHGEPDPTARASLLAGAERAAAAGIALCDELPWRDPPRRDLADLYAQMGRVSMLRNDPLPSQLAIFDKSYRIFPTQTNMLFLAEIMLRLAMEQHDLEMARRSLALYAELVAQRAADAPRRAVMARVLDAYRRAFPALAPEVDAVAQKGSR
jgi:hypothetical protein